ncbi:dnaJ subfamily B member 12 [Nephila pilipes]|uniref:DnaJ subfamily B member 12 n=1 Tax=Nephila pilipes TaxID=299642 RepID=A0A8X6TXL6_NEPPI|nr:dnaJ subfamily B member 12 [Nephila pilipes]
MQSFIIQSFRCKSHYASLGIDSTASQKDIKSAYYKLSVKFHPDKNDGSKESIEKFREITEAYEVLGNPERKKAYDEDFRTRPYYHGFERNGFSQRTGQYYGKTPRSGKDKYYNYDEHYRQHYAEYMKQREMENEYFKQRWRADRRARHGDDYYEAPVRDGRPYPVQLRMLLYSRSLVTLLTFWFILLFAGIFIEDKDRPQSKVYYDSKKEEKND